MASDDAKRAQQIVDRARMPGKTTEELVDLYADWAKDYDRDLSKVRYNVPVVGARHLAGLYPDPQDKDIRIIDVAGGTGLGAYYLSQYGFTNVDGTDISQEMLDEAKKLNRYQNYILAAFGPQPTCIEENSYDALLAVGCFTSDHMREDSFPEFRRIVKPGGKIVFTIRMPDLTLKPTYRDYFEQQMDEDERNGLWKKIARKVAPNYYNDEDGVVYMFENC